MADPVNYGISATNVSARNMAVGQNARIDVSGDVRLAPQLAELLRAIDDFDGVPATRDALSTTADAVAQELQQPAPDKHRILERLSKIDSIAGPVGAIANATTALAALAEALL
jgi:hypothetical protein